MSPAIVALMIPLIVFSIPIVAILTAHQRKMAEIIHRNNSVPAAEIEAIRQEMREMRTLIHQQAIALDDVRTKLTIQPTVSTSIPERLSTSL